MKIVGSSSEVHRKTGIREKLASNILRVSLCRNENVKGGGDIKDNRHSPATRRRDLRPWVLSTSALVRSEANDEQLGKSNLRGLR